MPLIQRVTTELHTLGSSAFRYAHHSYGLDVEEKPGLHILVASRDAKEIGHMGFQPYVTLDSPFDNKYTPGGRALNSPRKPGYFPIGPVWGKTDTLDYNLFWILSTMAISFSRKSIGHLDCHVPLFEFPALDSNDSIREKYQSFGFSMHHDNRMSRVFWEKDYLPFTANTHFLFSDNIDAYRLSQRQFPPK